jgi:hypothetical protein
MAFILIFVVGMLIIPVMIDSRKHPNNNILRRADRDLLEFKVVNSIVRRFSALTGDRLSDAFPGAVMLSFLLGVAGIVFLVVVAIFAFVAIFPILIGLVTLALNLVVFILLWFVGKLTSNIIFGFGGLGALVLIAVVFLIMRRRAGNI